MDTDENGSNLPVPKSKASLNLKHFLKLPYFILAFLLLVTVVITRNITTSQNLLSQAAASTTTVSVQPANISMPPDQNFQIWLTSVKPIGFIRVSLKFNPAQIKLNSDPEITNTLFSNKIIVTSAQEANQNGTIVLAVGLSPTQKDNAPTETFQLASLNFSKNTENANAKGTLEINISDSQIVDMETQENTIKAYNSDITVNPSQTNISATNTPAPTPDSSYTTYPTPSNTPKPNTPYPTKTPSPRPTYNTYISPTPIRRPTNTPQPTQGNVTQNYPTPTAASNYPSYSQSFGGNESNDDITVDDIKIDKVWNLSRMEILARSSKAPQATLEVKNYGKLIYDSKTGYYRNKFWVHGNIPKNITVVSSKGGSRISDTAKKKDGSSWSWGGWRNWGSFFNNWSWFGRR